MKITFTFTDTPDIQVLSKDDIYNTHFEIPDEARQLPDLTERILAIAQMVGQLTLVSLHITCKELSLQDHLVKSASLPHDQNNSSFANIIVFKRWFHRKQRRQLKILLPIPLVVPQPYLPSHRQNRRERPSLNKNLMQLGAWWCKTEQEHEFANTIKSLAEQLQVLLLAESNPYGEPHQWRFMGYHPWWYDTTVLDRLNKRGEEERKRAKEEEKRKAREAKLALKPQIDQASLPKTGAGRRPGAVPGVFKGVQFRSQLEIRFATELESRQIQWFYETERLGEGNYLVDFYLPAYKAWVEVKGKFEPRDDYLLKDVAAVLKRERGEKLYIFTQSKGFAVNPSGFRQLPLDEFWKKLLTLPSNRHKLTTNDQQLTTNDEE